MPNNQVKQENYRLEIERLFRTQGIVPGGGTRSATLSRSTQVEGAESVNEWILSTEKPTTVFDWERWEFVEEILMADGMVVPRAGQVPLLDTHARFTIRNILGHVNGFGDAVADGYVARSGLSHYADDEDGALARSKVDGGHLTDGSVGYQVLASVWVPEKTEVTINGRTFVGPVRVVTEWLLKEFSLCPIGADVLAKVRQLCG